ncbi:MerR family transcriptional regulator [Plantibacter flavus]|uniref:MerR family transcriptional regulator n=1 Tax=Plantibacter flavus TaxID=150123 RepID=UPI003F153EBE
MDWSIQEIAKHAGTTSRTLRHYEAIGLLPATRIGGNGYRRYDGEALVRLQRILLLRELGLGLPAVAEVLDAQDAAGHETTDALREHLAWLQAEQDRLEAQIASVEDTITRLEGGEPLMAEHMFDGFDHTQHQAEVEERWGEHAFASGDRWWRRKTPAERTAWQERAAALASDWADAAGRGVDPVAEEAQALAARQYEWLSGIPGTPQTPDGHPTREYFTGLGEMYVTDARFSANYGGEAGASFVRDAMTAFAEREL